MYGFALFTIWASVYSPFALVYSPYGWGTYCCIAVIIALYFNQPLDKHVDNSGGEYNTIIDVLASQLAVWHECVTQGHSITMFAIID